MILESKYWKFQTVLSAEAKTFSSISTLASSSIGKLKFCFYQNDQRRELYKEEYTSQLSVNLVFLSLTTHGNPQPYSYSSIIL